MSGLPAVALPTSSVTIAGTEVAIRGLSRAEAFQLREFQHDPDAAEVFLIARGTDVTGEQAAAWRESTDFPTVDLLSTAIATLSGLAGEDGADPKP